MIPDVFLSWEIFFGLGALLLLVVIAYGVIRQATRDRAKDRITEEATRMEYKNPERYERERECLQRKAKD